MIPKVGEIWTARNPMHGVDPRAYDTLILKVRVRKNRVKYRALKSGVVDTYPLSLWVLLFQKREDVPTP